MEYPVTEKLLDGAAATLGIPFGIRRYLQAVEPPNPPAYAATAGAQSLAPVHRWARSHGEGGFFWRQGGHFLPGGRARISALASLVTATRDEREFNIRDIVRLSSSKTDLTDYASLDAMAAEAPRCRYFWELPHTQETLESLWAKVEPRITGGPFERYSWAEKVGLINSDGSHRFVMSRYLAGRLGQEKRLSGECRCRDLNPSALNDLDRAFRLYWLPDDYLDLADRLDWFGARYGVAPLDGWPGEPERRLLVLPLSDRKARRIMDALDSAGWETFSAYVRLLLDTSRSGECQRRRA